MVSDPDLLTPCCTRLSLLERDREDVLSCAWGYGADSEEEEMLQENINTLIERNLDEMAFIH